MSVIGEAILTAIVEEVVKAGLDRLVDKFNGSSSIESQVQSLEKQLPRIKAIVEAAESGVLGGGTDGLQSWLWMLKDALYEADDVLDEMKYLDLKKHVAEKAAASVQEQNQQQHQSYHWLQGVRLKNFFPGLNSDPMLKKLSDVINKLHQVAAAEDLTNFYNLVRDAEKKQKQVEAETITVTRATTTMLTERSVVGRDEQKEEIIKWLMQSEDDVRLISIVGHGGMGKTTLAQFVLEDDHVKASFDPVMWAYVSPSFDVARIIREMLESARARRPEVDSLGGLQGALKDLLVSSTKKFLLVLDDAWDDRNSEPWEKLLAPMKHANKGGKILLTTRSSTVARKAEQAMVDTLVVEQSPMRKISLGGLKGNKYLKLFNRHAFFGRDKDSHPQLLAIGKEIAEKLGGSPLLAKVVGRMLNENFDDGGFWNSIRSRSIPDDVMSNLKLTYQYLSPHLRPCFAYCSILHNKDAFSEENLVHLWMAVGLVQEDSSGEAMENIGRRHFNDLLKRSFFEPFDGYVPAGSKLYKMHDVLYELAESVFRDECFTLTDDKRVKDIPNRIRHLKIKTSTLSIISNVEIWGNLRSLSLSFPESVWGHGHAKLLSDIFRFSQSLRVLILDVPGMDTLPETIDCLRHLRYLRAVQTIKWWPSSLSRLYNLQTLDYQADSRFPSSSEEQRLVLADKGTKLDMTNMINLRHLNPVRLSAQLPGIGKLASLHELEFHVRQETGLKIAELKALNELRELSVEGLENVMNFEEAREAQIHEKQYLEVLKLSWFNQWHYPELHEEVLEGLKPNSSLKILTIEHYMGMKAPSWMSPQLVEKIEFIKLSSCLRLEQLSSLWKLNCLTNLCLINLSEVKVIGPRDGFQQLQVLNIERLEQLEKWCEEPGPLEETSSWFPRLRELDIRYCPKLMMLPSLPLALRKLHLESVGLTALPKLWFRSKDDDQSSNINRVWIQKCPKLISLANSFLQQQDHLRVLMSLEIHHCEELMYLPVGGFGQLCSLRQILVSNCPKLQLPQLETALQETASSSSATIADVCFRCFLPASLERLVMMDNCGEMERSLPTILKGAVSLSQLALQYCNSMTSLPPADVMATLTSLKKLWTYGCEQLMSLGVLNALLHPLDFLIVGMCPKLLVAASAPVPPFNRNNIQKEDGVNSKSGFAEDGVNSRSGFAVRQLIVSEPRLLLINPLRNLTSVHDLIILDCSSIQYLDEEVEAWLLRNSTSLVSLKLWNASSLLTLPTCIESLTLLKLLDVGGCNEVLKHRLQDGGADWPHIKHIHQVYNF